MERFAKGQQTSILLVFIILFLLTLMSTLVTSDTLEELPPTVLITVLVRNQAHALPYFLESIEKLNYPKDRISLWIRSDHNTDNSSAQLDAWLDHVTPLYHSVDFKHNDSQKAYPDQESHLHWSEDRLKHVTKLRQEGLATGRRMWADYVLMIDADVILTNPETLQILIDQEKTIVAPLMNVKNSDTYSNFWGDINENSYYKRSDKYYPIRNRLTLGCHEVALVHSVLMINLNHGVSQRLNYFPSPWRYKGPLDDMVIFAQSAKQNSVQMYILNTEFFGHLPLPMETRHSLQDVVEEFVFLKTEAIINYRALNRIKYLHPTPIVNKKDKLGVDQVYVINLKRQPEKREKIQKCFDEMGIDFIFTEAVDGELLNRSYIKTMNVRMLPSTEDPSRILNRWDIGSFLSHYNIWLDVVEKDYKQVAIFEDDARFESYFWRDYGKMLEDVDTLKLEWDLIYLGGMSQPNDEYEEFVTGTERLVKPSYIYSTMGYLLTHVGVKKLLSHYPVQKMVPIDEYIAILLDSHTNVEWKNSFYPRDLIGLSADPALFYQELGMDEDDYNSNTDDSEVFYFTKDGRVLKGPKSESDIMDPHSPSEQQARDDRGLRGDTGDLPEPRDSTKEEL